MSWEIAASIAEVISAIAVVVSLIYLSTQIRAGNKVNQANAFQATVDSEMHLATMIVEHAAIWEKVVSGALIAEGAETREAIALYNIFMLDAERRYHQYHAGYLDIDAWQGVLKMLPATVALPIFAAWRTSFGAMARGKRFLELVDEIAAQRAGE